MEFSEKRKFKRIKRPFTAKIRLYSQGGSKEAGSVKWDIVTMKNLSATGMSFNYTKELPVQTVLEFNISVPFIKEPIHCIGQVCRIDRTQVDNSKPLRIPVYWIAVQFKDIDETKKEALVKFSEKFCT
jgi:hypothetical protein